MQLIALKHHETDKILGYRFIDIDFEKMGDIDLEAIQRSNILPAHCTDESKLYPNNGKLSTQEEIKSGVEYADKSNDIYFIDHMIYTLRYRTPYGIRQGIFIKKILEYLIALLMERYYEQSRLYIVDTDELSTIDLIVTGEVELTKATSAIENTCKVLSNIIGSPLLHSLSEVDNKIAFKIAVKSDLDTVVVNKPLTNYAELPLPSKNEERLLYQLEVMQSIKSFPLTNIVQQSNKDIKGLALMRALEVLNKNVSYKEDFLSKTKSYCYLVEPYFDYDKSSNLTLGVNFEGMLPVDTKEYISNKLESAFDSRELTITDMNSDKFSIKTNCINY